MGYSVVDFLVSSQLRWIFSVSECASRDLILREYKKVVKRHIETAKGQIRRRRFNIAIDETMSLFTGE